MADLSGFAALSERFAEFAEDIGDARDDVDAAMDRGVEKTARDIGDAAQRRAPVDTGELRDSKRIRKLSDGRWEVAFTAQSDEGFPYPQAVEYGRGPIVAEPGSALRFEIDGEVFYRQRVQAASPQPFLRPALRQHRSELTENIREELRRTIRRALD